MAARETKTRQQPKGVRHHAKRLYRLTPRFVHGMVIGAFTGTVLVMSLGPILPAGALTLNSPRDCDSNAVISCGALTTGELKSRYKRSGVAAIYKYFGISGGDINNIDKYVKAGRVYKNGEVRIGNKVVARNALTAGRHYIRGSKGVVYQGARFYTRAPKVSFRVNSIAAFVVLEKGVFQYAILGACGNPVKATALTKPKLTHPAEEEVPEAPPPVALRTSTQTPDSTPTPIITASAEESKPLPVTGPGDIGLVVLLAVIGGYLYHITHRHIRHRRHQRHSA